MKTSKTSCTEEAQLTASVVALTAACPMGVAEPSCVLRDVRTKSANEQKQWVAGLTKQEKQRIVAAHDECSSSRKAAAAAKAG